MNDEDYEICCNELVKVTNLFEECLENIKKGKVDNLNEIKESLTVIFKKVNEC